jgi:zinc protease
MKTNRLFPLLAVSILFVFAHTVVAASDAATVDSILEKYVKAVGGKAALEKVSSRALTGKLEHPAIPAGAEWRFFAKAPDKQVVYVEIPGWGSSQDGFDGQVAWSKNPSGLRVKTGEELAKAKRDAQFMRELSFKTIFPKLSLKGLETVDGKDVYVLESVPSENSKETFYFSKESGLLVRQDSEFATVQGKVLSKANMSDYRAVDGVQYAHLIKGTLSSGGQEMGFDLRITGLKQNVPIDDKQFAKPGE